MYSAQGKFQHYFQCKKVRTILNKIRYFREWSIQQYFLHQSFSFSLTFSIFCPRCHCMSSLQGFWKPYLVSVVHLIRLLWPNMSKENEILAFQQLFAFFKKYSSVSFSVHISPAYFWPNCYHFGLSVDRLVTISSIYTMEQCVFTCL